MIWATRPQDVPRTPPCQRIGFAEVSVCYMMNVMRRIDQAVGLHIICWIRFLGRCPKLIWNAPLALIVWDNVKKQFKTRPLQNRAALPVKCDSSHFCRGLKISSKHHSPRRLSLVIFAFFVVNNLQAQWPVFRGDTGLSGVSSSPLPDKPVLLWK